jgi:hypothetical protein
MHYGLGPEVYADYRRHELHKAAPRREPLGKLVPYDKLDGTKDAGGGSREWIGRLLIAAGERLGGALRAGQTTRRTT